MTSALRFSNAFNAWFTASGTTFSNKSVREKMQKILLLEFLVIDGMLRVGSPVQFQHILELNLKTCEDTSSQ